MPDDISGLVEEFEDELARQDGKAPPSKSAGLPVAKVQLPAISRLWIKWLPLSIMFFGLAFVSWTVVQVVTTIHRSEETSALERRVETLEAELIKAKKGEAVEYWVHQCELMFLRGEFQDLEKPRAERGP